MNIHSAIIKGPNKEKLQDAIRVIDEKHYTVLIIADGLGSAINSDYGAKKAVLAVERALHQWRDLTRKDDKVLIQLIHFNWNLLIGDSGFERRDCLTTCVLCYIDKVSQKVILGQLGDGLVYFKTKNEIILFDSFDDFNFTKCLGSSTSYADWQIKSVGYDKTDFTLIIATDGISEDLVKGKEGEFAENLIREMYKIKRKNRNAYLYQFLKNWPTKFHSDDKTICIAWQKKK